MRWLDLGDAVVLRAAVCYAYEVETRTVVVLTDGQAIRGRSTHGMNASRTCET